LKSHLTQDFIASFKRLPDAVKAKARKNYRLWRSNPSHPSLHFKRIHAKEPLYSVRVGINWRAIGLVQSETIYWFWIGSHSDYDEFIKQF